MAERSRWYGGGFFALPAGGLVAAGDGEFAEDLGDVELDAVEADAEAPGDLVVRQALAEESEHLPLTGRKDVGVARAASLVHRSSLAHGGGDLHYPPGWV